MANHNPGRSGRTDRLGRRGDDVGGVRNDADIAVVEVAATRFCINSISPLRHVGAGLNPLPSANVCFASRPNRNALLLKNCSPFFRFHNKKSEILGMNIMFWKWKKDNKKSNELSDVQEKENSGSELPVNLTLNQVFHLAKAAFEARGFPRSGVEFLAEQIAWLEARGLPALTCLTAEFTILSKGVWSERQPKPSANNQLVFDCPFISGVILEDYFEQLVDIDPNEIKGIMGPTSPLLILPRIARYSEKIGVPVQMYFKSGEPIEIVGCITTDGDKILVEGDVGRFFVSTGLSFSRSETPLPDQAHGPIFERATIGEDWMLSLAEFIARD